MCVRRDYNRKVISKEAVMEIIGTANENVFTYRMQKLGLKGENHGRRGWTYSINDVNTLARDLGKEVFIPEEFIAMCTEEVPDRNEETADVANPQVPEEPKPSTDWAESAEKLAWMLDMSEDDIVALALARLKTDIITGRYLK